ncbi:helix-turn-helix domain-containing protein [Streptomyces tsukubensis]|uniref:helix-turn-helix domain-containing protein n=1 Tax=Streptomyces tsukubensis TaxID=83656 RepID=UPI001265DC2F|nr:helix-turn-helix transcriptional regulator [Streptomyces tsukubensis]QFR97658.1 helix-turn-helix domain-containing protein [Streptomyces tsukubensis]
MARSAQQVNWEFFGEVLKKRREAAKLTQTELGERVFVSAGYISQFESGIRKPQLDIAIAIDRALQTDDLFEHMCRKLINKDRLPTHFANVPDLEAMATRICEVSPTLMPGLLQIPDYIRAVILSGNPLATDELIEDVVSTRTDRQSILEDATRPLYWVFLHETVLRIRLGGSATMAAQLAHVAKRIRDRHLIVQIIPTEAGGYAAMQGNTLLMEFEDAPPTLYTETSYWGALIDDPLVVKQAYRRYDLLRAVALSPEASLALIDSAAEDYRRCASAS